jgi:hypothetical protein
MREWTCYIKGVSTIRSDIQSTPTLKVNSWLGASKSTINNSPMLKPCSSSSKPSMDISVSFHCSHPALDHTWRKHNALWIYLLEFYCTSLHPYEGWISNRLMPQVNNHAPKFWMDLRNFEMKCKMKKEPNQVQKFKPPCILLMNSHLILSLKPICSTPFPSQNFI